MNVLLIYPKPDMYKKPRFGFSYNLLLIATVLSFYHNVKIKDYSCEKFDKCWLIKQMKEKQFELVLIECDSFALKRSENVLNTKEILSIFKGHIPSIVYGNYCCIKKKKFEDATRTVSINNINAIIDCINELGFAPKMSNINEYDQLPYIDRKLLLNIDYYKENSSSTLLQTSIGCENTCIFCQRKGWQDHYIAHSDEYVLNELDIIKKDNFKNVWITDENFSFNLSRAKNLLRKITHKKVTEGMNLFISSWANIDFEFIDLCVKSNVKIVSFGIESGSEKILKFYRKNIKISRIPEIVNYANEKGIFTVGNFILGAPMESEETVFETFNLIKKCNFDQVNIKTLDYMIGSELYNSLDAKYKVQDHVFSCLENGLTKFKLEELKTMKEKFLRSYYLSHKKRLFEKINKYGQPYYVPSGLN